MLKVNCQLSCFFLLLARYLRDSNHQLWTSNFYGIQKGDFRRLQFTEWTAFRIVVKWSALTMQIANFWTADSSEVQQGFDCSWLIFYDFPIHDFLPLDLEFLQQWSLEWVSVEWPEDRSTPRSGRYLQIDTNIVEQFFWTLGS